MKLAVAVLTIVAAGLVAVAAGWVVGGLAWTAILTLEGTR